MSVHVWSWVLKNSPAGDRDVGSSPVDRLVLLVLADHAHGDGTGAHPDEDTIAREARCKKRSVYYALDALKASGCIVQTGATSGGVREWQVLMTPEAARAKFAQRPTRKPRQPGAQSLRVVGANDDETRANDDVLSARTSINRQEPPGGTGQEPPPPPGRALTPTPARGLGEGESRSAPPEIVIPRGASARTVARLTRTAQRTGVQLVHERSA